MPAHTPLTLLDQDADTMASPHHDGHATITPPHTHQEEAMSALSRLIDEVLTGDVACLTRLLRAHYQVA